MGLIVFVLAMAIASTATHAGAGLRPEPVASGATLVPFASHPSASLPALVLGIANAPKAICAFGLDTCPAGAPNTRVTLTADAGTSGVIAWPAVQVAFVLETTLYDGVFDPNVYDGGEDPCTGGYTYPNTPPCEESNGVPFFVSHAQQIANGIAAANPKTSVSFALVDYFATCNFDDCDGSEYHVDIQHFVPSAYFGSEVQSTFVTDVLAGGFIYGDSDFSDNILHSSSITALYGTIIGSGLNWSKSTHHVVVWLGSTAPRDLAYQQNYCVSASGYDDNSPCLSATCEPSYQFPVGGASPNCEGWIHSQDGNATHSIAALAHTAPACTTSIGAVCTIDTVDYVDTATDPFSKGWPSDVQGGGPGGTIVQRNVDRVLLAGCDLAAATGGTWEGPAYFTCPSGQTGTLQYVSPGKSLDRPNTNNPSLYNALRLVGFGPVLQTQVAAGTNKPIFQFVPFGNIALPAATDLQATATCLRSGVPTHTCQRTPVYVEKNGLAYLAWNWSTNKTQNVMYVGDYWTASFNVYASGPPYSLVPVDACITTSCKAGGSAALLGFFTSATYVPYTNNTVVTESFPLAQVTVELTPPAVPPPSAPPPPAVAPPGLPVLAPIGLPITQPIGVGNTLGVGSVSLQAVAAGFLAAGFMRVSLKNKPIAMKIAAKAGPGLSKFDRDAMRSQSAGVGRFE